MGRKKIEIQRIDDVKNREVTFNKRKVGLMKKAIELSVLCDCQVAVIVFHGSHLYQYSSEPCITQLLEKYNSYQGPYDQILNEDLDELKPGKASSFKVGKTFIKERYEPQPALATVVLSNDHMETSESSPSSSALASPPVQPPPPPPSTTSMNYPQQQIKASVHLPPAPSNSLLSKRKKRTLNVHIPVGRDQSVIELSSSYSNQQQMHSSSTTTNSQPPQPLYSPTARYVRGSGPMGGMLAQAPTSVWPPSVPCISPPYLHYSGHSGPAPPGTTGLSSSLNTPTLSPFAPYPTAYNPGPSSPVLPLATYAVGQL